jgi:hypothetical protein
MRNLLGALCLFGFGAAIGCSSDGAATLNLGSGGTTATGGATGAGGRISTTEGLTKDWTANAGAAGSSAETSNDGPYGDLFADPYFDPNDPCSVAVPWITGVNTKIVSGDLVVYEGKVYKYDSTTSSCNTELTNMFDQCIPSAPAEWCKPCWILQEATCA